MFFFKLQILIFKISFLHCYYHNCFKNSVFHLSYCGGCMVVGGGDGGGAKQGAGLRAALPLF